MSPEDASTVSHGEPMASHRRVGAVLAGVCLMAALAGCSLGLGRGTDGAPTSAPAHESDQTSGEASDDTIPTSSAPAVLQIPSIQVREELIELGIQPDGTLEVPSKGDDVGWYLPDGNPEGPHPTVFAGHVDTTTGPAVFYRLQELELGDEVEVTAIDGKVRTYRVDRVDDHPVDAFPTREVFGPVNVDEIRLITCTGKFDTSLREYEDNRVVYASHVD